MQSRVLILITANFPYGYAESYLEYELPFLAIEFDRIIVLSNADNQQDGRSVPQNVEVIPYPYLLTPTEKIRSLTGVFSSLFWRDLFRLVFRYKRPVTYSRLATMLGAIYTGRKLSRFIVRESGVLRLQETSKIYAYSFWCNNMAAGLAFLKRSWPSVTAVSRAHGYDVYFERNEIDFLPLRDLIFKSLDAIYFVSNDGLEYSKRNSGAYPSFQISRLGAMPVNITIGKTAIQPLLLCSCSSAVEVKRIHMIVEALCLVEVIAVRWVHIGAGPLINEIRELAETVLAKKENIHFELTGQLNNKDVLRYYENNSPDVFINVSESEGLPVSIIEAMAAGMAVIATDAGGTREIVKHNYNGRLLPKDTTPEDIAMQIMSIRPNLDEYKRNAFATWATHFDARIVYPAFVKDLLKT